MYNKSMGVTKDLGHIAEMRFVLRANEKGLFINRPMADFRKYDFITDFEGILKRVQIKSTFLQEPPKRRKSWHFSISSGSAKKVPYSAKEIDFVVAYIDRFDCFYIIPIDELEETITISLNPYGTSKYNKYLEAWDLLMIEGKKNDEET